MLVIVVCFSSWRGRAGMFATKVAHGKVWLLLFLQRRSIVSCGVAIKGERGADVWDMMEDCKGRFYKWSVLGS